jgi:hypothetical protein
LSGKADEANGGSPQTQLKSTELFDKNRADRAAASSRDQQSHLTRHEREPDNEEFA